MVDATDPRLYDGWGIALSNGSVALTRCARCLRWQWYPLAACPICASDQWDWVAVEPTGNVQSWTRVMRPTVGRQGLEPPYVLAIIELPQADRSRVVALATSPLEDPIIGGSVCLVPTVLGGSPVLQFKKASVP